MEYKSALKGIPKSVWDTYSSFANTDGGKIVLGVGETDEGYVLEGVPNINCVSKTFTIFSTTRFAYRRV